MSLEIRYAIEYIFSGDRSAETRQDLLESLKSGKTAEETSLIDRGAGCYQTGDPKKCLDDIFNGTAPKTDNSGSAPISETPSGNQNAEMVNFMKEWLSDKGGVDATPFVYVSTDDEDTRWAIVIRGNDLADRLASKYGKETPLTPLNVDGAFTFTAITAHNKFYCWITFESSPVILFGEVVPEIGKLISGAEPSFKKLAIDLDGDGQASSCNFKFVTPFLSIPLPAFLSDRAYQSTGIKLTELDAGSAEVGSTEEVQAVFDGLVSEISAIMRTTTLWHYNRQLESFVQNLL